MNIVLLGRLLGLKSSDHDAM